MAHDSTGRQSGMWVAAALLVGMCVSTGSAVAANPAQLTDATARDAYGAIDDAGTLRVAWRKKPPTGISSLLTCLVPRGAGNVCSAAPQVLAQPAGTTDVPIAHPFVYRSATTTRIALSGWPGGRTYVWTAGADGVFGAPVLERDNGPMDDTSSPGVQEGTSLVTLHKNSVQRLTFGGGASTGAFAQLTQAGSHSVGHTDLERVPGGGAYVASSLLDGFGTSSVYWVNATTNVETAASWSAPQSFPTGGEAEMASGPLGLFAVTANGPDNPLKVHKWTGSGWGAAGSLPGPVSGSPRLDVVQAGGKLWVVGVTHRDGSTFDLTLWSSPDGATWSAPTAIHSYSEVIIDDLRLSVAPDGKGFVLLDVLGNRGVTVVDLDPLPAPPAPPAPAPPAPAPPAPAPPAPAPPAVIPAPSVTPASTSRFYKGRTGTTRKTLRGSRLVLTGPAACVPLGKRFVTSLKAQDGRSAALRARGLVRVRSVTFRITNASGVQAKGPRTRVSDGKTPFASSRLSTAGLVRGRAYRVRVAARYRVAKKPRLGTRTTTIIRTLKVC